MRRFVRSVQQGERSKHGVGRVARAGRDPSGPDSISYRGHKARCQAADGANGLADCSRTRGHARSGPRRQRAAGPRRPRTRACVGRRSSRSDAVARGKEQLHHPRSCRRVSKPRATRRRTAASRRLDAPRQDRLEKGRVRRVLVGRSDAGPPPNIAQCAAGGRQSWVRKIGQPISVSQSAGSGVSVMPRR